MVYGCIWFITPYQWIDKHPEKIAVYSIFENHGKKMSDASIITVPIWLFLSKPWEAWYSWMVIPVKNRNKKGFDPSPYHWPSGSCAFCQ